MAPPSVRPQPTFIAFSKKLRSGRLLLPQVICSALHDMPCDSFLKAQGDPYPRYSSPAASNLYVACMPTPQPPAGPKPSRKKEARPYYLSRPNDADRAIYEWPRLHSDIAGGALRQWPAARTYPRYHPRLAGSPSNFAVVHILDRAGRFRVSFPLQDQCGARNPSGTDAES